jgi:hypothetical protein
MRRPLRLVASLVTPLALCAPAACGDAPTLPDSFAQQAGGRTWVAVSEPAGLPDARTWLRWDGQETVRHVRELQRQADAARDAQGLEAAMRLESQARLLSATLLTADPPARALRGALGSVREWERRAAERLSEGRYPGLDSTVALVRGERAAAEAALARGDARGAALHLASASESARFYSPLAVGLRLVASAEQRIDADPAPSANLQRARLLLRLSREALATGDETRAMKRAWYALQLIDADAARSPGDSARPR